jgi:hypothetical protein
MQLGHTVDKLLLTLREALEFDATGVLEAVHEEID